MRCYQKYKTKNEAKDASEEISGIIISDIWNSTKFELYSFSEGAYN